ncbi:hypothetical protein [Streptomyces sp. NPDC002994]|uniref:hypothetical protein n=1 Tax=Streptomyces sp. NPDC002994 TaxID=3154441 RepID=UPI0033AEAD60
MATRKSTSSKTESPEQVRQRQFPAKAGEEAVEVDQRSPDGAKGTRHIKEFVVPAARWTGEDYQHEANRAALVGEAIQRGLHPRGDVAFDGQEDHPDGVSLILTYSVDTVPSSVDHNPEDTTTPRDVIDGDTSKSKDD